MVSLFTIPVHVKIYRNKFVVSVCDESGRVLTGTPDKEFTTNRLLVGNFKQAEVTLKQGIKKALGSGIIKKVPVVVIHPMEKVEGGLSEVEHRVFKELALGSGAAKVYVHEGKELSKDEVIALLKRL